MGFFAMIASILLGILFIVMGISRRKQKGWPIILIANANGQRRATKGRTVKNQLRIKQDGTHHKCSQPVVPYTAP